MTKSELTQLIKECLNEIDFVRPPTTMKLKIVSIADGYESEVNQYIPKMVDAINDVFDEDVIFTKNFKEPYEKTKLPDDWFKDPNHIEVKTHFTIIGITDETDKVEIIESLQKLQENLTTWAISKDLANIDFYFSIDK